MISNKLTKILNESHLQQLYHYTGIHNIRGMIESNSVKTTFSAGADDLVNEGKKFYLSASRVKWGKYAGSWGSKYVNYGVVVLDGAAVKDIASVKSVEYWGEGFRKLKEFREEQEERIMTNKAELKPLSKYVDEIHIYVDKEKLDDDHFVSDIIAVSEKAPSVNVPVYFYDNMKAFKIQIKQKAKTNVRDIIGDINPKPKSEEDIGYDKSHIEYREKVEKEFGDEMKVLMDIYDKKDIPSNKTSDRMIERLTRFISDTINAIEADIHNARTKHYGVFDSLSKFMRKNKLASTVDLIKADMEIAKKYEKNKKTNIWEFDELP